MRYAVAACALAIVVFLAIFGVVLAQKGTIRPGPDPAAAAAEAYQDGLPKGHAGRCRRHRSNAHRQGAPRGPAMSSPRRSAARRHAARRSGTAGRHVHRRTPACAGNPNALGVTRVVEIDTTGGPGFGFEHFKQHDFLRARRGRADLRRRPVAAQHAGRAGGARRPLHQGDLLPDRQALDVGPRNPQAGRRRRPHDRQPHLVACRPVEKVHPTRPRTRSRRAISAVHWALGGRPRRSSASPRSGIRPKW